MVAVYQRCWQGLRPKPRLCVIVWRDATTGPLSYHGPPRWCEIEGIEEPRVVRAHDVTGTLEEIVEELRRTDETRPLEEMTAGLAPSQSPTNLCGDRRVW